MSELPIAKKSLGQHWLTDQAALRAMCEAGQVTGEDTVLEIGPGTGTLTRELVKRAKQVIAVEFDQSLAATLSTQQFAKNLQIVREDILRFDLSGLPPDYKVVANIPYYLTSNLIRVLSEASNQPVRAVLLVQKEVAQRVTARPGTMSLLSVTAQFYWEAEQGMVVPARLFTPPPKVDSQILMLHRRARPLLPDTDPQRFFRLVKAGFSARRKKLRGSISGGLRLSKVQAHDLLLAADINPDLRPQELSLQDWHRLYQVIENK